MELVDLPLKMVAFHSKLFVYQRVPIIITIIITIKNHDYSY